MTTKLTDIKLEEPRGDIKAVLKRNHNLFDTVNNNKKEKSDELVKSHRDNTDLADNME